jgi:FtsH-binding integral membrane protein
MNEQKNEIRQEMEEMINDVGNTDNNKAQEVALNVEQKEEQPELNIELHLRLGFIRKVYGIISFQILITVILCALTFNSDYKLFMYNNRGLFWLSLIINIGLMIPLICFKSVARKVPGNYILLSLWTIATGYMVSCCTLRYDASVVLAAAFSTLIITFSLSLYAITTKRDFTAQGGILFALLGILFVTSILCFFLPFLYTLVCIGGLILYSGYLLYDTQLLFGKIGREYSLEDYIFASMNIYMDIIQIFLYLLRIFGRNN